MNCTYLTDIERRIRSEEIRQQYPYFAEFKLHGVKYIRWFQTTDDRTKYIAWLNPSTELLSVGPDRQQERGNHVRGTKARAAKSVRHP